MSWEWRVRTSPKVKYLTWRADDRVPGSSTGHGALRARNLQQAGRPDRLSRRTPTARQRCLEISLVPEGTRAGFQSVLRAAAWFKNTSSGGAGRGVTC